MRPLTQPGSQVYLREHRNQQVEVEAPASGESDDTHVAIVQYNSHSSGGGVRGSQTLN